MKLISYILDWPEHYVLNALVMASTPDETTDGDGEALLDFFQEPDGYYAPEKLPTTTSYECRDGTVIDLRLVGHSPLWVPRRGNILLRT